MMLYDKIFVGLLGLTVAIFLVAWVRAWGKQHDRLDTTMQMVVKGLGVMSFVVWLLEPLSQDLQFLFWGMGLVASTCFGIVLVQQRRIMKQKKPEEVKIKDCKCDNAFCHYPSHWRGMTKEEHADQIKAYRTMIVAAGVLLLFFVFMIVVSATTTPPT